MKTIPTEIGWEEVTTKIYRVEELSVVALCRVSVWLEQNARILPNTHKRHTCKRCKQKWEKFATQEVYMAFTDKGNQAICRQCYIELAQPGINCPP